MLLRLAYFSLSIYSGFKLFLMFFSFILILDKKETSRKNSNASTGKQDG